jgi:membrane protease YdiL (CAAX protease family)
MSAEQRRLPTLAGLVVALIFPALLTLWSPAGAGSAVREPAAIVINEAVVWMLALIVIAIVRFWERRPLASIGLVRPTGRALAAGAGIAFALLALAGLAGAVIEALGMPIDEDQTEFVLRMPVAVQMAVAASAGFTEEVLFRGYPIERLTALTGRRWLGAAIPVLVFGAVHAPFWGVAHALVAGISGLWLTLLYLWRRNLWTNIAAHAIMDAAAFLAVDLAGSQDVINT